MEDSDSEKDEPPPANEIPTSSRRVTGPVKQVRAPSYSSDEMYIVEPAPIVPRAPPSSARRTQQPARRHSTDVPVVPEPARVPSPIVARNAVASSSVSKAEAPHRVFKSRLPLEFLAEPLLPVPVAVASILDPVVPIPRVTHRQPSPPPSFSSSKLSASPPEHGLPLPRTSPVRSRREQLPEFQSLELSPSPSPEHLPSSPIRPGSFNALGQSKHLDLDDDVDAPYPYPPDSPIDSGPFEAQPPRFVCPDTWQFPLQPRKRARTPAEERNWPELASSVDRRDAPVAERDEDDSGDDLIVTRTAPSTFSRGKKGKGRQQVDLLGTDSMQTDDSSFFDSRDGSVRGGSDSESTPTSVQALTVPKVRNRRGKGRHKGKKTVAKSTSTTRRLRDPTGLYGTFWALAGVESEGRRRAASPELGEGSRYPRRLPIPLAVDIPTTPQEEIVEPCKQTHEEVSPRPRACRRCPRSRSLTDSLLSCSSRTSRRVSSCISVRSRVQRSRTSSTAVSKIPSTSVSPKMLGTATCLSLRRTPSCLRIWCTSGWSKRTRHRIDRLSTLSHLRTARLLTRLSSSSSGRTGSSIWVESYRNKRRGARARGTAGIQSGRGGVRVGRGRKQRARRGRESMRGQTIRASRMMRMGCWRRRYSIIMSRLCESKFLVLAA
jgi:hypothetical protein